MAHISGKAGQVDTGSAVSGIKSWTLDYNVDMLETTDFADAGVKTFIAGGSGWSGTFEGYKDGVPQTIGASITLKLYEEAAGAYWTGTAFITGISAGAAIDGIVSYSYTFTGTGALTVPIA
jgi:predicted secreted protein